MDCKVRFEFLQKLAQEIPALDVSSVEPLLHLLRAHDELYASLNTNLSRFGLSPGKIKLIMLLYKNMPSGMSPSDLAERIGVTRGTITGLLDGLERDGIIERTMARGDRRMLIINMTDSGLELIRKVLPEHFEHMSKLMSKMTPEEKQTLNHLLEKLSLGIQCANS